MATKKSSKKNPPISIALTNFWSDLNYIPAENKGADWCSLMIYFAKRNSRLFLDPKRAKIYRDTDSLLLNEGEYKRMVDPVTPMGGGGKAEYFSSDWKANPVYIHLKNIVKADIQRTAKEIEVNCTDKYAKTRKMRDNYRILYQKAFRELINELAPQVGIQGVSEKQDPYKWVQSLTAKMKKGGAAKEGQEQPEDDKSDIIDNFVDLIKNKITDSQDMALYNELIYKGDYEIAFELGIKHYLINENKWLERWSDEFLDDLMHFNKACGEWYTDLITGRPVIERFVPERLFTSPFKRKDGEDLMYYFIEYEVTFADFVRTIGKNLSPQKLKDVFEFNKTQGSSHGLSWIELSNKSSRTRDNAMIRIGKMSALTQDYSVNLADYTPNYPRYQTADLSWQPIEGETAQRDEKHYNVWYSWYYIPPTSESLSNADYTWQAQFVFDIKKNQDQFRYGEDGRYSKSPLVIYDNSHQASFTDIVQYWMPKIHHASHKFQNCLVNDVDATILSDDLLGGLLNAVDEENGVKSASDSEQPTGGNARDVYMEQWKMIKQNGVGFLKMTDKNGQQILDPTKMQLTFKNNKLEQAEKYLGMIAIMYSELTKALAISNVKEGEDIKPRTPIAALQESIKSSNNAQWYIQLGYESFIKMYGERIIQYIITIAQEAKKYGYTKRWEEFMNVVGAANGLAVEGMEDVPPESVGMTVNYVDNTSKKELIVQLAIEYVKQQALDDDFLYLMMGADNWKYSFCLLRMGIKKKKEEMKEAAAQQQQYIMQQKDADLKIAQALNAAKTEGKNSNIVTQGKIDAMIDEKLSTIKQQQQLEIKQKISDNRMEEDSHKANIELQKPLGQ